MLANPLRSFYSLPRRLSDGAAIRPIVVSGPPAAGKSAVGRALAARLDRPFVDLDERIEAEAGRSAARIFAEEGEPGFRDRERRALDDALCRDGVVVAVGAGALVDAGMRRATLKRAHVLSLTVPLAVLAERAGRSGGERPLLGADAATTLSALLQTRAAGYAEAHARIDARAFVTDAAARAVAAVHDLEARSVLVMPLGVHSYAVRIEPLGQLAARVRSLTPSTIVVVTDRNVQRLHGPAFADLGSVGVVLAGRRGRDKSLANVQKIWEAALGVGIDRDAVLVAVGGGVVTDLAGFAASTLLRGVRYASAPTTLLAMVDASIGGKTGIDRRQGKNLVGTFHQPSAVHCDPALLATQAPRDVRAGLAEVLKIALATSASLLSTLEAGAGKLATLDHDDVAATVPDAMQAKIDVVADDEREGGRRALLNFGHTIGHALEHGAGFRAPHGECVAVGMRAAIDIGERMGVTPTHVAQDARALLDDTAMPARMQAPVDVALAEAALAGDKKRQDDELRFVLLDARGSARLLAVARREALASLRRAVRGVQAP